MIIKAKQEHFDELFSLIEKMIDESVFSFAKPNKDKIKRLFNYPKNVTFLAYNDDKCIGFISLLIDSFFFSDYERATDVGFYVLPENRGSTTSSRLIKEAEKWAKEQGIKEICMGQSVGNKIEETKKFYIHHGYEIGGFNGMKRI